MFKKFIYSLLILFCTITSSVLGADFQITDVKQDHSGNMFIMNGTTDSSFVTYDAGFSQNPLRAYIDINNAVFTENKKILEYHNKPIKKVAIAQYSTHPNKVRLVFYANNIDDLKNIKLIKNGKSLVFKTKNFQYGGYSMPIVFSDTLPKDYKTPQPLDVDSAKFSKYILTNVTQTTGGLLLSGIGNIKLSRHFILSNPMRIVYDMQNAIVQYDDMYKEYKLDNGDTIKVGKFNTDTLRFVVTTNHPQQYKSFISPDLQSVHIVNIKHEKTGALINTNVISVFKKANLKVNSAYDTLITLEFDKPIIPSFRRTNNRFYIDFLNVTYDTNEEFIKLHTTAQFNGFTAQRIEPDINRLSLSFPVCDDLKVENGMSLDGKVLSIKLKGSMQEVATMNRPVSANNPSSKNKKLPLYGKVIVVDAGHGGKDAGAISGKMHEKVAALEISKYLQQYLEERGATVIMTRKDDTFLSLQERVEISNNAKTDAFVSVHLNSSEKSHIHGIETHWYKPDGSKILAQNVQNHMVQNIEANNRGLFRSMFYVINHTTAPAILVETGFISNPQERSKLFETSRQKITAKAIADGITEYFKKK